VKTLPALILPFLATFFREHLTSMMTMMVMTMMPFLIGHQIVLQLSLDLVL
jgi:hypothetical protein